VLASVPSSVLFTTKIIDADILEGLRPTADVAAGRIAVASLNLAVRRVEFSLQGLALEELRNMIPFDPANDENME
jgi:hypothetical protein